jgi:hypothetical protein
MSAFLVAIGGKADMAYCTAHVCYGDKADISRERHIFGQPLAENFSRVSNSPAGLYRSLIAWSSERSQSLRSLSVL